MTPETKLKRKFDLMVKEWQRKFPDAIFCISLSDRYTSGLPDKFLIINEKPVFVEFKSQGKWLSKLQDHIGQKIINASGYYWVMTELDNKIVFFNLDKAVHFDRLGIDNTKSYEAIKANHYLLSCD